MEYLIGLAVMSALGWFWYAGLEARERATHLARDGCSDRDLQFLDGTVAHTRTDLARRNGSMRIRRRYRFEFADREARRYAGRVVLVGLELEELRLDGGPVT
ncbi:MAG: DUF3301 domain-containing protein [Acidiferrobacterales bacterium]